MEPIMIVVTGPESSGKSALCQALSAHLETTWIPEFARNYLEERGPHYENHDLLEMHKGHSDNIYNAIKASENASLIIDTDSINYAVWEKRVFGKVSNDVLDSLHRQSSHIYLVCYPDLAWEADPLRQNPNDREAIFEEHLAWIKKLGRPYAIVKAQKEERLKNALAALQKLVPSLFSAD